MKDKLLKRQEELKNEWDRQAQILKETEVKLNQLSGAFLEIERQLKELETPEVQDENKTWHKNQTSTYADGGGYFDLLYPHQS